MIGAFTLTQSGWETLAGVGTIVVIVGVLGEAFELYSNLVKDEIRKKNLIKLFWMVLLAGLALEFYGSHRARLLADESNARLQHQSKHQSDTISEQQARIEQHERTISNQQYLITAQRETIEIQQRNVAALQFNTDALLGLPADEMITETETSRVLVCSTILRPNRTTSWIWQDIHDDNVQARAAHWVFFKLGRTPVKNSIHGFVQSSNPSPHFPMSLPAAIVGDLFGFGTPIIDVPLVGIQSTQNIAYTVFDGWTPTSKRYFVTYLVDPHETNTIKTIEVKGTNVFLDGEIFN